jgi:predicted DNA-binding protein
MAKNINADKILKELQSNKHDRKKTSLYLSEEIYNQFKAVLKKRSQTPSQVIEKLMADFIESLK